MTYCLGRTPKREDARTLRFCDYNQKVTVETPDKRLWQIPVTDWGVMGNDRYGNCVIATAAHKLLNWRANELGDTRRITDSAVIALSRVMGALEGYNILDRLKYWRKVGMWGDLLWAFTSVETNNKTEVMQAINLFGSLDMGVNLPTAWQGEKVWGSGSGRRYEPGSWGGHSVPAVGYDPAGVYVVSWGEIIQMTWTAVQEYCDEGYALIDANWLAKESVTPNGFDLPTLYANLQALK